MSMDDKTPPPYNGPKGGLRAWAKGTSGNPGGTTKAVRQVRDMLKKLHPDCEVALRGMIANWQDDPRSALGAIQIVYARSIGKERDAEQLYKKTDTVPMGPDLTTLSDDQLTRMQSILREGLS